MLYGNRSGHSVLRSAVDFEFFDLSLQLDLYLNSQNVKIAIAQTFLKRRYFLTFLYLLGQVIINYV